MCEACLQTSDRIQHVEELLANKKYQDIWIYGIGTRRFSFQPYAIDTLKQLLPYAKDQNQPSLQLSIQSLEYLFIEQSLMTMK